MRVLMVKTSSMGDILHSLPALTDAILAFPNICVEWVIEEEFIEIPSWHPAVNRVVPVAIRRWRKNWFSSLVRKEYIKFKNSIQLYPYDAIIDAQGLLKSATLISRLAKGIKHGADIYSTREPLASLWYDKRYSIPKTKHALERTRILFAKSLNYDLPTITGDYAIEQRFRKNLPLNTGKYTVCIHATTRWDKEWPEIEWRKLISFIQNTGLYVKLPWGNDHERLRAQRLAQGFSHVEVLPKLTLEEIAYILAGARAVVSVDTGLSHLAAALNCPNITLYGPTNVTLIRTYGKNQIALFSLEKNMATLTANKVQPFLRNLLYETASCD
ncbi:lipopolysaccharide heptosyltransferase RfaC [Candidatus Erwinia haradaeae]|uniref:Lipopolysaccharide heptosyltransferase 1 n=1 Tax=Candidatus Erwinia haradaeae TaxID=1922217 RepID=A0A451DAG9_9GAMM|nr:lipopolysaccharide heptosyltransferase RfaC [Candidatus Erwinia haradaeae]VFP83321.1 Lipopolysaccharide heptosyltransferase 1 [Candidatus Erwinia haradaeae]